jgi:hypothetical protein
MSTTTFLTLCAAALGQPICDEGSVDYDVVFLDPLVGSTFAATALNNAGEVAGWIFADDEREPLAFVWQDGDLRTRSFPGELFEVRGINEDGVVLGRIYTAGNEQMFLWFSRTDDVQLVPTEIEVFPWDFNENLLIVGVDEQGLQGFALDLPGDDLYPILFGDLPEQSSGTLGAAGVNAAGLVVGSEVVFLKEKGYYQETPYRWTIEGGIVELPGVPDGFGGRAVDVNASGNAAGYVLDDFFGKQTALWIDEGRQVLELGSPFGFFVSEATALNDDDQLVVVAPNDLFGFTRAFLWDDSFIDLSCFTLDEGLFAIRPLDINDEGEILVQLSDEQGLVVLDIVVLRPEGLPADIDGDGVVGVSDLVMLILAWGPCVDECVADLDGDGDVGVADLVILITSWS